MSTATHAGRRILVVGGSRGIGLALAVTAATAGAAVATAARTPDADAPGHRFRCDVRDPADVERAAGAAVEALGGLDAVVHLAGTTPLSPVLDTTADTWHDVLATNVVGAALTLAAVAPALQESAGRAVFVTSTMVGRPWPGLAPYSASRAALEEVLRGVRQEHPDLQVSTVVVGPASTGSGQGWDPAATEAAMAQWRAAGFLAPDRPSLTPEAVAAGLLHLLASPVRVDHLDLLPDHRAPGWVDR